MCQRVYNGGGAIYKLPKEKQQQKKNKTKKQSIEKQVIAPYTMWLLYENQTPIPVSE